MARPAVRVRLTLLYSALFGGSGLLLAGLSYWLVREHLERMPPGPVAPAALASLQAQYALALGGTLLVAVALGWVAAGRALAPVRTITALARRVSDERLDERIALDGPHDEMRELADTFDAMLDRLQRGIEGQRRFVANASHELRTPLTVIRAEVEAALEDPRAGEAELRATARKVLGATCRMQALLDSLLLLARAEQAPPRREPADLAAAARLAAEQTRLEAAQRGVTLELALAPARLEGDARLVERLVGNLVENAVRHGEEGSRALVWTGRDGHDRPAVRVESTGAPLGDDALRRLAQPFHRLEGDRRAPGTGLGLSIVRSVADAHGAELALRARPEGGLVAEVAFPGGPASGLLARAGGAAARANGGH
jgi:signal transduction histidine kinase